MNQSLTSLPVVILTGAGASKWLGKATTYDIYESVEFQRRSGDAPFSFLPQLRAFLQQQNPQDPVDLEYLLDSLLDITSKFDALRTVPQFDAVQKASKTRDSYAEAYEQALDFMVDYYGNVERDKAAALYEPFFEGLQAIMTSSVIPLFTLNYDEAVESAVDELADYTLVDGFRTGYRPVWSRDVFDKFGEGGHSGRPIVLFKLHGSVSWTRPVGSDRIERTVSAPRRRSGRQHVILYPTRLGKAIDEEPFASAYAYLKAALANARVAVFVGTSLRDAELLAVLRHARELASPPTLVAVGPEADKTEIASRTGSPVDRVRAVRLSFEPEQIPELLYQIKTELANRT